MKTNPSGRNKSRKGPGAGPRESGHDRSSTEETILEAVSEIVREKGFLGLGVNAVAEKAGAAKVLIYRYFGDLGGLLEAWALKNNFWGDQAAEVLGRSGEKAKSEAKAPIGETGFSSIAEKMIMGQIRSLRSSKESREILRWFLAEENPLSAQVMAMLEDRGDRAMRFALEVAGEKPSRRLNAGIAVIVGGIYYLALIADRAPVFNGVDLRAESGWKSIGEAARDMALGLLPGSRSGDSEKTGGNTPKGKGK